MSYLCTNNVKVTSIKLRNNSKSSAPAGSFVKYDPTNKAGFVVVDIYTSPILGVLNSKTLPGAMGVIDILGSSTESSTTTTTTVSSNSYFPSGW